jgi:hypothetical protein
MNKHLPLSKDIKTIIGRYTLSPINRELELLPNYITIIRECLDNKFVYRNDKYSMINVINFNNIKYKRIKSFFGYYWTLRLKTDL